MTSHFYIISTILSLSDCGSWHVRQIVQYVRRFVERRTL